MSVSSSISRVPRRAAPVIQFLGAEPRGDRQTRTLQRKRSYLWNTIGDFSLKIRY